MSIYKTMVQEAIARAPRAMAQEPYFSQRPGMPCAVGALSFESLIPVEAEEFTP